MGIGWSDQIGVGSTEEEAAQASAQSIADLGAKIVYPYSNQHHFYTPGGVYRFVYTHGDSPGDSTCPVITAKPFWVREEPFPGIPLEPFLNASKGSFNVPPPQLIL